MKRTTLLLISLLVLAGCGKPSADDILSKMHDAALNNIDQKLQLVEFPKIASTSTVLTVTNEPVPGIFEGKGNLNLKFTSEYDVSKPDALLFDAGLELKTVMDASQAFFASGPAEKGGPDLHATADLNATLKSAGRKLFFNLGKIEISIPGALPAPFILPKELQTKWYSATFDEINAQLKKSTATGAVAPTIDELLKNSLSGNSINREAMNKLIQRIHLWKGIEVLPEQDGNFQVRVESDKQAIAEDMVAFNEYMLESAGSSWNQFSGKTGLYKQKYLESVKSDIEKGSSVRGVLSVDKDTYDFRGFTGEIFSSTGSKLGDVNIQHGKNGDILVELTDVSQNNQKLTFTKTGTSFSLSVDGKQFMTGTVSDQRFTVTVIDPKTNEISMTADLPIVKVSREELTIENGTITFPTSKLSLLVDRFQYQFQNSFKDLNLSLNMHGLLADKPLFTTTLESNRKEQPSISVESPTATSPFSELQQDLVGVFMGGTAPAPGN